MATGKLEIGDWQKKPSPQDSTQSQNWRDSTQAQTWQEELKFWSPELQEAWQERAAIRYFDGGLNQEKAERLAFEDVKRQIDRK